LTTDALGIRATRKHLWLSVALTLIIGLIAFRVTASATSGFLVWSDGLAYFFHARSLVLDGNSDITNEFEEFDRRYPLKPKESSVMDSVRRNVSRHADSNLVVSPWPIGMGMVLAPFYALGFVAESVIANFEGREADTYGIVPQYFFCFGSLVFGWLGFWATYLCCRQVADQSRSYLAAASAVFGGPAAFYIFINPSMAHAVSFGLTSILVLLCWRRWVAGTVWHAMLLPGFILGLLVAIRLQNALFGLLLVAVVIRELCRSGWLRAAAGAAAGLATSAIPMAALLMHSAAYGPVHSKFTIQQGGIALIGSYPVHLKSPFFFDVLFSCRHGAFYWAPILAFGALGLVWAIRRESWAVVLLSVFLLNVYLIGGIGIIDPNGRPATFDISNWNGHWKGGASFGMRYLTECTALFAVGLATLLNIWRTQKAKLLWSIGLSALVVWNSLLMLAYGLNTVSRTYCVRYDDMWHGVTQAIGGIVRRLI
jgi:hypothetical protein